MLTTLDRCPMQRRDFFSALGLFATTSAALAAQAEKSPIPDPDPKKAEKLPDNVDAERYARAPVVLRARLLGPQLSGDGMYWYQMKVIATLKNTVRQRFGPTQDVFTTKKPGKDVSDDPGLPREECTIYLEPIVRRVDGKDETLWRLLDGNSTSGVSHVAK